MKKAPPPLESGELATRRNCRGVDPTFPQLPAPTVHVYRWKNNPRRAELYGRRCRIEVVGRMGSVLVRFEDNGERVVTSRRALRRTPSQAREVGMTTLDDVLTRVYRRETNIRVECFWDEGWHAQFGDEINGFRGPVLMADTVGELAGLIEAELRKPSELAKGD